MSLRIFAVDSEDDYSIPEPVTVPLARIPALQAALDAKPTLTDFEVTFSGVAAWGSVVAGGRIRGMTRPGNHYVRQGVVTYGAGGGPFTWSDGVIVTLPDPGKVLQRPATARIQPPAGVPAVLLPAVLEGVAVGVELTLGIRVTLGAHPLLESPIVAAEIYF